MIEAGRRRFVQDGSKWMQEAACLTVYMNVTS